MFRLENALKPTWILHCAVVFRSERGNEGISTKKRNRGEEEGAMSSSDDRLIDDVSRGGDTSRRADDEAIMG